METSRGNGRTICRENQKGMEPYTGQITTQSPSRIDAINQQKESFLNAQKRRESALQVIEDTIVFMEYLNRERVFAVRDKQCADIDNKKEVLKMNYEEIKAEQEMIEKAELENWMEANNINPWDFGE